ncbi:hypothetical protein O1611_g732 [Lasiodiplodia mahajangana]|uniref:Uncharacterized protein n=1 Tax=Lasiodiplodia mahajangana TaxID=1108764 RepID=A0ACC2K0A7_9PEZI|nr:hypothetical protein O1611_g732 [Lasiodiplodia mahajangana]
MATDVSVGQTEQTERPPCKIFNRPAKDFYFHGRNREVQSIHDILERRNSVIVQGIAGVGKSSIALSIALRSTRVYDAIIWMRCEPRAALDQSCYEALREMEVIKEDEKPGIQMRQKWRDYLSKADFSWLVIFDNVENSDDLSQFLPSTGTGKIIITTRNPRLDFQPTISQIEIRPFGREEGRDCVLSMSTVWIHVACDPASAEELSNELGGLPLAMMQMTALAKSRGSIKAFLEEYRQNKIKYHNAEAAGITGIYPDIKPRIGTNWAMSFDALGDDAKSLLGILSFLSPDITPPALFNHWDKPFSGTTSGLLSYCDTELKYRTVRNELNRLALIQVDLGNGNLSMHRLQQLQLEHYLDVSSRQRAFETAVKLVYDVFPKEHIGQRFTGRWDDCAMYIQHAIVLNSHYLKRALSAGGYTAPPEFAKLMAWCSWYLWEIADYSAFNKVLEGGKNACEESPSDAFDEASWSLLNYNAGTVETSMGMFESGEKSLTGALKIRRELGNQDDIAATLNNLGLLYNSMHKFDLAEVQYSEALEIHLKRVESEDRNLSLTMVKHNLQRNAIQSGKIIPQQELQDTVDFFKNTISWWMTGHAYLVLGNLLFELRKYDDASAAYTTARDTLSREGRASKQPATAMVIYKLGYVAYTKSQFLEAAALFRESASISELYPEIPAEQARTQFMLAKALDMSEQTQVADEASMAREKVATLMKAYGLSIGRKEVIVCSEVTDFSKFITAKYQ